MKSDKMYTLQVDQIKSTPNYPHTTFPITQTLHENAAKRAGGLGGGESRGRGNTGGTSQEISEADRPAGGCLMYGFLVKSRGSVGGGTNMKKAKKKKRGEKSLCD